MSYLSQLYDPLTTISNKVGVLQSQLSSAERAFELLDEAADVRESPHARQLVRATGSLSLQGVDFEYEKGPPCANNL